MAATLSRPSYFTGYGEHVAGFIEGYIVQSKGRWSGRPITLEPWQHRVMDELFLMRDRGDGELERVYRQALIGLARKNGKSTLASSLAIHGLIAANESSPEVYAAAAASDQARIVFDQARRFVEASPMLRDWLRVYRNVIECKANGGIFRVLSSDGPLQHGLNPSLVLIDELWAHKDPELYYALTTAQGARENPLVVSITTAGWDRKSVLWHVYDYGETLAAKGVQAMRDARHYHKWFAAPPTVPVNDRRGWRAANPSSWIKDEDLEMAAARLPEAIFRRLHLNQWTESKDSWIKPHEWAACTSRPLFDLGEPVWMAADVGVKRDSAAIVWVQWHGDRLHVGGVILDPEDQLDTWGVADVRNRVRHEARRFEALKEVAYDPWSFRESAEILADESLPMVEFPQNASRMAPASENLYELIVEERIAHGGGAEEREQILAAVVAPTDRGGWRLSKRKSLGKIDYAVALAMAADRAVTMRNVKPKRSRVFFA